jgi:hypothetical protein
MYGRRRFFLAGCKKTYEINVLLREQSFGVMSAKPAEGTSINSFNRASYKSFRDYLKPEKRYVQRYGKQPENNQK